MYIYDIISMRVYAVLMYSAIRLSYFVYSLQMCMCKGMYCMCGPISCSHNYKCKHVSFSVSLYLLELTYKYLNYITTIILKNHYTEALQSAVSIGKSERNSKRRPKCKHVQDERFPGRHDCCLFRKSDAAVSFS